jgi:hypothetical protein
LLQLDAGVLRVWLSACALRVVFLLELRDQKGLCEAEVSSLNGKLVDAWLVVDVLETLANCDEIEARLGGLAVAVQALEN